MKKILFLLIATSLSSTSFAQFQGSIRAGMNLSRFKDDGAKIKPGYKVGGSVGYLFDDMFGLKSSLFFTTKGGKNDNSIYSKVNIQYLEFSVMPLLRMEASDITNFIFAAGPYVSYGLGGKTTKTDQQTGNSIKIDSFDDFGIKRVDAGFAFGFDVEIQKLIVGVDFTFGLLKVRKDYDNKNLAASISVGYKF